LRNLQYWRGVALIGSISGLILVFWLSGQLSFFIHPRYNLFTVVMTSIAVVLSVMALVISSKVRQQPAAHMLEQGGHDSAHDHDHDEDENAGVDVPTNTLGRVTAVAAAVVSGVALIALVVLPPATLSTVTVENRAINQAALGDIQGAFASAQTGEEATFLAFTVREWAGILRQTQDPAFFQGKPVDVVGFVVADRDNPGTFFVTRFVVSCCAVDAQPVGVPVYEPGFEQQFAPETWVRVVGEFVINPDPSSSHPLVLRAFEIIPTEQPRDPYLF
jgi:putative membrane protein